MFKIILSFPFLWLSIFYPVGNPKQIISCHYSNISFDEFCQKIEEKTDIQVFYKKEWVSNIKININNDSISVEDAFKFVLSQTNLKVNLWNNNILITNSQELVLKLPNYQFRKSENKKNISQQNYLEAKNPNIRTILTIGTKKRQNSRRKQLVKAKIVDIETNESLIGATLFIKNLNIGISSKQNGILEIYLYPGKYSANFAFIGYKSKEVELMVLSTGTITIKLEKSGFELSEVSVYGDKMMEREPGVEKIRTQVIKQIPTLMGEIDVVKISEMLPGIVSVGEGSAGINVRGGSADQNAFYINKIPIFNTSHLFGFSSAFNPDIIKDFSIYKGYIPLQFGGKLSSVFDIDTRHGNKKYFTAHGGISPLSTNIVLESPIIKDTASFIVSGRSSYSDWILASIKDPVISKSHAKFRDFSAEFNYDLPKTQISVFYYNSFDFFSLSDIAEYQYSNNGASLSINHNFSKNLRAVFSLASSLYQFTTSDNTEITTAYQQNYHINQNSFTSEFTQKISEKHQLSYGINTNFYGLNRGKVEPFGENSILETVNLGKEKGIENALYISDNYNAFSWLNITFGIRYSLYTPLGEKTNYIYKENEQKIIENIVDSVHFEPFEVINWNYFPEIRAAINIKTDRNGALKIAFNQMHQNLFMLNTTVAVAPNSQWKLADYYLKPTTGNQISIGVFRNFPSLEIETSLEAYYSQSKNYTEFRDGADFLNTPLVETSVLQGSQHAYGIEFMLKKHGKHFDGWLAYTYSRTLIQITGIQDWEKINKGNTYPANHDIPNSVNGVLNYQIKKRLSISGTINYQTGKPVTFPTSIYFVNENSYIDYSARNAYRIPDYFRFDLSLKIEGNLKKNKIIHSSWVLGLYNVTGRDNAYSVFFKSNNGIIQSFQYSVISVSIFTATWIFKLGNYESF